MDGISVPKQLLCTFQSIARNPGKSLCQRKAHKTVPLSAVERTCLKMNVVEPDQSIGILELNVINIIGNGGMDGPMDAGNQEGAHRIGSKRTRTQARERHGRRPKLGISEEI